MHALPPRRLEGAASSRAPRSCTSAAPRTAAGCTSRTCAGTCASSRSTAARARPSARGGCCSGRCGCALLVLATASDVPRGRALPRRPATPARCSAVIDYLRLAFGDRCVVLAARLGSSRARSASAAPRPTLAWALAARLRRVGGRLRACTARSRSRSSCSRVIGVGALVAGAARGEPGPAQRAAAARRARGRRRARLAALARRGRRHRRRALPPGARAQARRARRPAPAHGRRVQGRRAPSRATRSRSGTASSRSSRGSPGSTRASSCATRRRCSRRSRALVACEAGVAVFGSRGGRARGARRARSRSSASRAGHGGSYATLALPATAARQLLVPAAIALFFTCARRGGRPRRARGRLRRARARPPDLRALRAAPARRLRARARCGEWRRVGARARGRVVPTALVLALAAAARRTRRVSHNPSDGRAAARRCSTTRDQLVVCVAAHHFRLAPEVRRPQRRGRGRRARRSCRSPALASAAALGARSCSAGTVSSSR